MTSPSGEERDRGMEDAPRGAAEIEEQIRLLRKTAARGPFSLALFLGISIATIFLSPSYPLSPATAKALGPPPSPAMISTLLVFYSFFAILLILARMTQGLGGCTALSHVGFLTGFYAFYHVSGGLQENFYPVVVAGLSIIGLETYHAMSFSKERIAQETEKLAAFRRREQWSSATASPPGVDAGPGEKR
jgi:hypothetical protein